MGLVYLHTLVQRRCSRRFMSRKFVASDFATSNFRERSWIFHLERYKTSYENLTPFRGKFMRTKDEFRLHYFCIILYSIVNRKGKKLICFLVFCIYHWSFLFLSFIGLWCGVCSLQWSHWWESCRALWRAPTFDMV